MKVLLQDLLYQFILMKKRTPFHTTELLDYAQKSYVYGELSAKDYKNLFLEFNKFGVDRVGMFIVENIASINRKALH